MPAPLRLLLPSDAPAELGPALIACVRARVGTPELQVSQDETIQLDTWSPADGGWWVRFTYTLDHDFASQYDRTESWSADGHLDAQGRLHPR